MSLSKVFILFFFYGCFISSRSAVTINNNQLQNAIDNYGTKIIPGADQTEEYISYLGGKRVGMLVNNHLLLVVI